MTEWAAFDFDNMTEAQAAELLPKVNAGSSGSQKAPI